MKKRTGIILSTLLYMFAFLIVQRGHTQLKASFGTDSIPHFLKSFMSHSFHCEISYEPINPTQRNQCFLIKDTINHDIAKVLILNEKRYFKCEIHSNGYVYERKDNQAIKNEVALGYFVRPSILFYLRWDGNCLYLLPISEADAMNQTLSSQPQIEEQLLFDFREKVGAKRNISDLGDFLLASPLTLQGKEMHFYQNKDGKPTQDTVFLYLLGDEKIPPTIGTACGFLASRNRGILEIIQYEKNVWGDLCRCR